MEEHRSIQYGEEEEDSLYLMATQACVAMQDRRSGAAILMAPDTALKLARRLVEMAGHCQDWQREELLRRSPSK